MDPLITSLGIPTGEAGWVILQQKTPANFPALMQDPVVTREIAYFQQNAPKALTAQGLLADPRLQDFALTAFGLTGQSGMTALLQKVLTSDPSDPQSFAVQMADPRFTAFAKAFNYGGASVPAQPATPSSAEVTVNGLFSASTFASFSGTFAGVTVSNVDLSHVTTYQGLANALQGAFQRADGNRSDISVTLDGLNLKITDAKGRGTATAFAWTPNAANTEPDPTAAAPTDLVAGALAQPEQGGPNVTNPSFINAVVQQYTESQYQVVVGNTSNTLREALYAKQELPSITDWNSIIADRPLADVIQTVLGLPQSFGALDITQQAQVFSSRMNIADFQDPTKLSKLLNAFVAISGTQSQDASQDPAVQLMNSVGSSNTIINLTLPDPYATTTNDSYSSGSAAALLLSTALG